METNSYPENEAKGMNSVWVGWGLCLLTGSLLSSKLLKFFGVRTRGNVSIEDTTMPETGHIEPGIYEGHLSGRALKRAGEIQQELSRRHGRNVCPVVAKVLAAQEAGEDLSRTD